jgi:hypothetical protein
MPFVLDNELRKFSLCSGFFQKLLGRVHVPDKLIQGQRMQPMTMPRAEQLVTIPEDADLIGDWGIRFLVEECMDQPYWVAEITFRQEVACRLSHGSRSMSAQEHRDVLLSKALDWVAERQGRTRSGDTEFGDLG